MAPTAQEQMILITGATGFVGRHLTRLLDQTATVVVLVRDGSAATEMFAGTGVQIHELGSQGVVEILAEVNPDVVFHLATHYERSDPVDVSDMVAANLGFGVEVLNAASRLDNCRVVLGGSYLQTPGEGRYPVNLYAATKEALLPVARYFRETRGLPWTQVVLYDVYGPGNERTKVIPRVVAAVKEGQAIQISDPAPLHHFVHVDDVVSGFVAAAQMIADAHGGWPESVFLTSDDAIPPSRVVAVASEVLDTEAVISPEPYISPVSAIMVPCDGPRPPGWAPRVTLADGILSAVEAP